MIEKIILDYLNSELTAPVYMEVPKHPLGDYVVIEKTGSSKTNHLYTAMLTFKSHSNTMYGAATLNEAVKTAMDAAARNLAEVSKSKLNSDYNYTNITTKAYRYQAVYDIWHY